MKTTRDRSDEWIPTRQSLLTRLKNWDDQEGWREFFETYWRLVYGVARKADLNDAEAQDVVIWDQAAFHPGPGDAQLPARIHLLPLPPYSPELNPVEGLWDQTQDVTCNRHFTSLDHLEEALTHALRPFWETPARVLSLVHHWLHSQANATA